MKKKIARPVSARRQRNREAMKQTILDTARSIMRSEGVAGLTLQELARRLQMRPPSLYNYFNSKLDIYDALFRQGFQLFGETMQKATQSAASWPEDMRRSMEAYLTFALQNPELFKLCFERHVPGFVPSDESMQVALAVLKGSRSRVRTWIEAGEFSPDIPFDSAFDLVSATMHGLTAMHLANEPQLPAGKGRFGSLVPAAVSVFEKAWKNTPGRAMRKNRN